MFKRLLLLFSLYTLVLIPISCKANQIDNLQKLLMRSRKPHNLSNAETRGVESAANIDKASRVYVGSQNGLRETDKVMALPGQPSGVDFNQASFVVAQRCGSLTGPGCSSLGFGAMEELGPFRVNSDGQTLFRNDYAWNNVANVMFLESPVGVGFSYSNTTSDYSKVGDDSTAADSFTFLVNWLERFPEYKTRDFYITGESYAGHYVPQLAFTIISRNKSQNQTVINLKGVAMGNAWIDDKTGYQGKYEYYWSHALNSDETHAQIMNSCDFVTGDFSSECWQAQSQGDKEYGHLDLYNIYAPVCDTSKSKTGSSGSVLDFDPCSDDYVHLYLNRPEVQAALHVNPSKWSSCSNKITWTDRTKTLLPTIQQLIASGISAWLYSGDMDGAVPVTSSRLSINSLKLPVQAAFRPWYSNKDVVGGYVIQYQGLTLATVRGAGHTVPSYQPERALTMISAFLKGQLPPTS